MEGYGPAAYGDRWADIYDQIVAGTPVGANTQVEVAALADLVGPGPVLELGIGTGRVTLPLVERGLEVHGMRRRTPCSSVCARSLVANASRDGQQQQIEDLEALGQRPQRPGRDSGIPRQRLHLPSGVRRSGRPHGHTQRGGGRSAGQTARAPRGHQATRERRRPASRRAPA